MSFDRVEAVGGPAVEVDSGSESLQFAGPEPTPDLGIAQTCAESVAAPEGYQ